MRSEPDGHGAQLPVAGFMMLFERDFCALEQAVHEDQLLSWQSVGLEAYLTNFVS